MKKLRFKRVIIELNDDGSLKDGIIQYQQEIGGKVESRKKYNSLGIKNMPFSKPQLTDTIKKIKDKSKEIEGAK